MYLLHQLVRYVVLETGVDISFHCVLCKPGYYQQPMVSAVAIPIIMTKCNNEVRTVGDRMTVYKSLSTTNTKMIINSITVHH